MMQFLTNHPVWTSIAIVVIVALVVTGIAMRNAPTMPDNFDDDYPL